MTTDRTALFDHVTALLDRAGIPYALIGAAALAIHGVSRSTQDLDLLTPDARLLDRTFWTALPDGVSVDVRAGDAADPLAGVVRCRVSGDRDVDVVVGRASWQAALVARAERVRRGGRIVPTARVEDLVLLKLYAGGSQDRWDIEQLLARPDRDAIVAGVEAHIATLPRTALELWRTIGGARPG